MSVSFGDGSKPSPSGEERIVCVAIRLYTLGAHTKPDLKVHRVWIPTYRKRVLRDEVGIRTRDIVRQPGVSIPTDFRAPSIRFAVRKLAAPNNYSTSN